MHLLYQQQDVSQQNFVSISDDTLIHYTNYIKWHYI